MSTESTAKSAAPQGTTGSSKASPCTFDGQVVSLTDNKLVMTNQEGKEFSHTLATNAKLTCDGADCEADDLPAGRKIRVTTEPGNRNVATCVEAIDKRSQFQQCN